MKKFERWLGKERDNLTLIEQWWHDGTTLGAPSIVSQVPVQQWQVSFQQVRARWVYRLIMGSDNVVCRKWVWKPLLRKDVGDNRGDGWVKGGYHSFCHEKKWNIVLCKKVRLCVQGCFMYACRYYVCALIEHGVYL